MGSEGSPVVSDSSTAVTCALVAGAGAAAGEARTVEGPRCFRAREEGRRRGSVSRRFDRDASVMTNKKALGGRGKNGLLSYAVVASGVEA